MRTRFALMTLIAVMILGTPCYALTCHDLAMSYIIHDQDPPREPGDKYFLSENEPNPILMETTAYYTGNKGSHGDTMKEGYCAAAPELYGDVLMLYEALPQDDGTYKVGNYITTLEVRDTGYGYPTHEGKSKVRPEKGSMGTLESPELLHCDVRKDNLERCREWMRLTGGKVFAIVINGKG